MIHKSDAALVKTVNGIYLLVTLILIFLCKPYLTTIKGIKTSHQCKFTIFFMYWMEFNTTASSALASSQTCKINQLSFMSNCGLVSCCIAWLDSTWYSSSSWKPCLELENMQPLACSSCSHITLWSYLLVPIQLEMLKIDVPPYVVKKTKKVKQQKNSTMHIKHAFLWFFFFWWVILVIVQKFLQHMFLVTCHLNHTYHVWIRFAQS